MNALDTDIRLDSKSRTQKDAFAILGRDTEIDSDLQDILELLATALSMPVMLAALVCGDDLWTRARVGTAIDRFSNTALLAHENLSKDQIVSSNRVDHEQLESDLFALVAEEHGARVQFRASVVLLSPENEVVGVLVGLDFSERTFDTKAENLLLQGKNQLEKRLLIRKLNLDLNRQLEIANHHRRQLEDLINGIEKAHDGIAILDSNENYAYLNEAHVTMFGYRSKSDLVGKSWRSLYSDEDIREFEKTIFPALAQNGHWSGEAVATRVDGSRFHEEVTLSLIRDGGLVCVCRDISERVEQRQQLERAKENADKIAEMRTKFLASVSHEIRTPITGIIGLIYLLQNTATDKAANYLNLASEQSNELLRLIDEILDFSRLEYGEIQYDLKSVQVNDLLATARDFLISLTHEKRVAIKFSPLAEELTINTDLARLSQVLRNLISNAVKYTHEGYIHLGADTFGDRLILFVEDTGEGIPDSIKPMIFEPFVQARTKASQSRQGSGLGLSISKNIVTALGGSLSCNSVEGEGSRFEISFPLENSNKRFKDAN